MSDFEDDFGEMAAPSAQSTKTLPSSCTLEDLVSYAPSRCCIYLPCKTMWPNASVDDRIDPLPLLKPDGRAVTNAKGKVVMIKASEWLARYRSVECLTWDPGKPEFIRDCVVVDGGYIDKPGATTLNYYRSPPPIELGDAAQATRWVEHWRTIYPDDADHIIAWLACHVQRPGEKINHALVLGGAPKIGKDTLLEAVVHAVGAWNFQNIKLHHLISRNNGFCKSLFVRLSEARDESELGPVNLYRLNDHMKDMLATPPNTLRINEKYINEYYILNRLSLVITTNYRDALCLPDDDRRHYVAFSERRGEEFPKEFWNEFWAWYETGGFAHVAALLYQHDLSNFDPKAEPPKTDAFWFMVETSRSPAYGEILDAIEKLGNPPALTFNELLAVAPSLEWLRDLAKRKIAAHRLHECKYIPVKNPGTKRNLWRIKGQRQAIYAHADLALAEREHVAMALYDKLNEGG